MIVGDLNCRFGDKQEHLSFVDDCVDDQDYIRDIEIPIRRSLDSKSNTSGMKLLDILNDNTLLTLNGRKVGDSTGRLTYHAYNGSSTVDICITSWDLYDKIHYFNPIWYGGGGIHPPWRFFLHCAKTFGTRELKLFDF